MGLFFCYEWQKDSISNNLSNSTTSSSRLFNSSKELINTFKKSQTFSEKENIIPSISTKKTF